MKGTEAKLLIRGGVYNHVCRRQTYHVRSTYHIGRESNISFARSANIIPECIGLHDGEISFQCSDDFDNAILCGAYGVLDEELCINDWHNF